MDLHLNKQPLCFCHGAPPYSIPLHLLAELALRPYRNETTWEQYAAYFRSPTFMDTPIMAAFNGEKLRCPEINIVGNTVQLYCPMSLLLAPQRAMFCVTSTY